MNLVDIPSLTSDKVKEWEELDLPFQLSGLLRAGYGIDHSTGRITPTSSSSGYDTPWIYTKPIDTKRCNLDHNIKFNTYGYIPPRCLNCYKVVIMPKTYMDLHRLLEQERKMDVPCKCGIEVRDYTSRDYGGYFYCGSLEEGRDRYAQVRKMVDESLEEDTTVILKRGCTEYEAIKGPSVLWHMDDSSRKIDELIDVYVAVSPMVNGRQTEYQKAHVFNRWVRWAHSHGDFTYTEHNGGGEITNPPCKYHEGDIEGIKDELSMGETMGRAMANGDSVDPEMLKTFRESSKDFMANSGVDLKYLTNSLSYAPEMITDADQTT